MKNSMFKAGCVLAMAVAAHCASAQTADASVTNFGKRAPTLEELQKVFTPAPQSSSLMSMALPRPVKKSIELELLFPFASADISPSIKGQLGAIGEFLQTAQLGMGEFLIEGHTDGVGAQQSNKLLSERRAQAVKSYLVSSYKVSPQMISTSGAGASNLKDARNPSSEANRRVEFSMIVKE
jgi:outer membrane protein OmpA-like peptidoglycan-associated protein